MKKIVFVLIMFVYVAAHAQNVKYLPSDSIKLQEICALQNKCKDLPFDKVFGEVYPIFLATPYVAHTLEGAPETLTINLRELDCTTFLENVIVISILLQKDELSWENYVNLLRNFRYRDGIVDGYGSRIHYTSDWIANNEQNGFMHNITKEIGGEAYMKTIDIISKNREKYPYITDKKTFDEIKLSEDNLNRKILYYIPKNKVAAIEKKLQTGDIIAITTSVGGLDVTHVGFAVERNNRIHLLHASMAAKKVVISNEPLHDYLATKKSNTGIIVGRVTNKKCN